jgi:hypothetical protein
VHFPVVVHGADLLHSGSGTWSRTVHGVARKHIAMYDLLVTSFSFLLACIMYNTYEIQARERSAIYMKHPSAMSHVHDRKKIFMR